MWFVGVDGGGSTCRARVRDGNGIVRATATGGAANVYLDVDAALRTIEASIRQALQDAGAVAGVGPVRIGIGLAGASNPAVAARVRDTLAGLGEVAVTHDGDIACRGAHAGADGGLIIAGTGSAAFARIAGRTLAIGGRGFILGDDGSGARLGLEALRRALRAHDGLDPHTALTRRLMAHFGDDSLAAIVWGRTAVSSAYAAFAPWVIEAAAAGDDAALALVGSSAAAIADLADALRRAGAPRLCLVGGLADPLLPFLPESLRAVLCPALYDALDGALLLAGCPLPSPAPPL